MAKVEKLRANVEQILKDHLGVDSLVTDEDGDYPIRSGSAKYYVRLGSEDPPLVSVYAHVLVGVEASAELYLTLNTVNQHITFGRFFHQDTAVLVATELLAETLDPEELTGSCRSIADLADYYDDLFKEQFGGETMSDDTGETNVAKAAGG